MIELHRLGGDHAPFQLNPDLIQTVEANPDTVVTLTTGTKVLIGETPGQVHDAIREWRTAILADALGRRPAPVAPRAL